MFWIINAILIIVALAFVLPSLFRQRDTLQSGQREQNIFIANEQLKELETRFEKGEIDSDDYQSTRDELEQSLYSDINDSDDLSDRSNSKSSLLGSALVALLIPVIAIPVYLKTGNLTFTDMLDSKQAVAQASQNSVPKNADGTPDIDTMVATLQKKMDNNPDNPKGWYMLGRSYMVLKRYPEAAKAFESAYKLKPDSADTMLSLADALSMSNQGQVGGRAADLVNKALTIEPKNLTALWLSGMAARQQGNYLVAIAQWNKVLPLISDQPQQVTEVNRLISEAKSKLSPDQQANISTSAPLATAEESKGARAEIKVSVSISEKFKSQAAPTDLVFIYAKAMSGPPMPLAALRKQVKDLPIEVVLNDEMAMMPNLKLSSFDEVIVGARVSKSGQPISQNGDLYAEKSSIKAGDSLSLEIDSIISK